MKTTFEEMFSKWVVASEELANFRETWSLDDGEELADTPMNRRLLEKLVELEKAERSAYAELDKLPIA